MKNEYGERLDRNGYAPSIIPGHDEQRCWRCGKNGCCDHLDRHEIFGGAYRKKSKELGLWVYLCHNSCHEGPQGIHMDKGFEREARAYVQSIAEEHYGWTEDDFRQRFGRSYR